MNQKSSTPPPVVIVPVGGCLQDHLQAWMSLTDQTWIHQVVQGLRLEFTSISPDSPPHHPRILGEEKQVITNEVEELLQKKAIEPAPDPKGFFSNIFPVPKKDGGWRPVIDLHRLNMYIRRRNFKMESVLRL